MSIKVKLERQNSIFDKFRNYQIYADNKKIAVIEPGEQIEVEVPQNSTLKAKIDFCSSNELKISDKDSKHFVIKKSQNWGVILLQISLLFIILDLLARYIFGIEWLFYFILPGFFYLIYAYTFGRKKYLSIMPIEQ